MQRSRRTPRCGTQPSRSRHPPSRSRPRPTNSPTPHAHSATWSASSHSQPETLHRDGRRRAVPGRVAALTYGTDRTPGHVSRDALAWRRPGPDGIPIVPRLCPRVPSSCQLCQRCDIHVLGWTIRRGQRRIAHRRTKIDTERTIRGSAMQFVHSAPPDVRQPGARPLHDVARRLHDAARPLPVARRATAGDHTGRRQEVIDRTNAG